MCENVDFSCWLIQFKDAFQFILCITLSIIFGELKALDTFNNNCQRPVFSLGVLKHTHKINDYL